MKDRTFYKYANKLGFKKNRPPSRHKKHIRGIRAAKPNELWHADLTIFRTQNNVKVYIYIIMDNHSRKILSYQASLRYSAELSLECLKEAYVTHIPPLRSVPDTRLMVDGGSEINNYKVDRYLANEALSVQKIVAQQDVAFSNSMIEAVNKLLKYNYLFKTDIPDYETCVKYLDEFIPDYNDRYHCSLKGLSPNEAFYGLDFDLDAVNTRIKEAKLLRIIENRSYNCPTHG
jgi:putative transposase